MREYREVRKELSGDEAAPYIGLARVLLGALKLRMHIGGLAQLSRSVTLPDGTTISVASRHGQDSIRIGAAVTPAAPTSVPPEAPQPFTIPQPEDVFPPLELPPRTIVAGWAYDDLHYASATIWKKKTEPHNIGRPFGSTSSWATGISVDGRIVVGYCNVDASTVIGFRWTASGGFQNLGSTYAIVTGVSYTGEVVVGYDDSGDVNQAFYWTPRTGLVLLPAPAGAFYAVANGVSGNGNVIVGQAYYPGFVSAACTWDRQSGKVSVIAATSGGNSASANGSTVVGTVYGAGSLSSYPARWRGGTVTNLGMLPGGVRGQAFAASAGGNVIVGSITDDSSGSLAFYWTAASGLVNLGPRTANGVTADGAFIAGMDATMPVVWNLHGQKTVLPLPAGMIAGTANAITNTAV